MNVPKNNIQTMKTKYRKYCKLFLEGKISASQYRDMCYISDIVQRKGWKFFTEGTTLHLTLDLWFSFDLPCLFNDEDLKSYLNQCAKLYIEEHKRKIK